MKNRVKRFLAAAVMIMVCTVWMGGVFVSSAADNEVYRNNIMNVVVSSDDGNCSFRSGPGLEYNVMQLIYNGTSLRVTGVMRNSSDGLVWGQTTYNGYTGWISIMLTVVTDVENSSRAVYDVTVAQPENIYLRLGPGAEYPYVYRPYGGQVLRITQTVVNSFDARPWGKTTVNGMTGWVSLDWTTRNSSAVYNQSQDVTFYNNVYNAYVGSSDGSLNLRNGPGLAYGLITPVYNGTYLYVTAVQQNSSDGLVWGYTNYNGTTGWVSMKLTTITNMDNAGLAGYYVSVRNSSNLYLRRGPGAEYDALVSNIPNGTSLYITQTVINSFDGRPWGKTRYNGADGWISLDWTERIS